MATDKKVVKVEDTEAGRAAAQRIKEHTEKNPAPTFKPTEENKKKATNLRIISILLWVVAIGFEVAAILFLRKTPINMVLLIVFIALDLIAAVSGNLLWKKANRLDPASRKESAKFFIQNQLGAFISVIAFLPLVILILADKDISGKQKGILAAIAIAALGGSVFSGVDTAPPSVEQYTEQAAQVEQLTGQDHVYWTKSGTHYHLYDDCHTINKDTTTEIFQGTVAEARELKNITDLCKICMARAEKDGNLTTSSDRTAADSDTDADNADAADAADQADAGADTDTEDASEAA